MVSEAGGQKIMTKRGDERNWVEVKGLFDHLSAALN